MNKILKHNSHNLTPRLDNLYFHNELDIFPGKIVAIKNSKLKGAILLPNQYELFLKQKSRRPIYDIYACFQPFNEATKAIYPFLKRLQKEVKKGDVILNLWDRTGWLTNLLAGLFPEQQIVTTWEGNKDVLGYNGFHFWMKNQKNVTILFCDLNSNLPLKDNSITFSIGLDTFHRFNQHHLLQELDRVVSPNGSILFPHVHLSNSEPTPFFERGGKQMHGMEYATAFDNLFKATNRNGYIFSEPKLFENNDIIINPKIALESDPNTTDYNALIALLPKAWEGDNLSAFSFNDTTNIEEARVLVNPLLIINLNHQKVTINKKALDGTVGHLLDRHPIYEERIQSLDNYPLTELAAKVIYLSKLGFTINEINFYTKSNLVEITKELKILEKTGLIQITSISEDAIRLQYFLMSQHYLIPRGQQDIKSLWKKTVGLYPNNIALISLQDQSEFSYEDCNEIIYAIQCKLQESGIEKGDKIIIFNKQHVESVLLFWACMQLGITVIPIASHLPAKTISYILEETESKWCFTSESLYIRNEALFKNITTIFFDNPEEVEDKDYKPYFSEWIEQTNVTTVEDVIITQTDIAVIIFTSGSTGVPKGVMLSQGNLFRSGQTIVESFHWDEKDRYFSLGGLDSMSGLRNTTISPLHVGASVIIPEEENTNNVFTIADSISNNNATIIGSNPALLRLFVKHKDKLKGLLNSIKTLICTGNNLNLQLRNDIKTHYNLDIYNYYGLSETSGICISQTVLDTCSQIDDIGKPTDCIAQIVDKNNQIVPIGDIGELRIFSLNLMKGYYNNSELTNKIIRNGWFYTQDLAKYNDNGTIELKGRIRNIIKSASEELIYIDEIQDYIGQLDIVEDAVVCSFKEEDVEKTAAFIVLKNKPPHSLDIIRKELRQKLILELGENKTPNKIRFIPSIPYTQNGKLIKTELFNEYS
jgi:acyl-coenzyme A synthetase/AMP-(fatty) acid ligase/SAM-dependent methyltransferase